MRTLEIAAAIAFGAVLMVAPGDAQVCRAA
jgi:hypothetical protein